MDFVFADFCGGIGRDQRKVIKTAFELTGSGGIVAVTSTLAYRGTGGYMGLYGWDQDNKRCLAIELECVAEDACKDVVTTTLPYKSEGGTDMFALIFEVK